MLEYDIRPGTPDDEGALLALFDEAVAWMVARGQPGSGAIARSPSGRRPARACASSPRAAGLWIAERGDEPLGALIVGVRPPHVAPIDRSELYIELLISSRRHAGNGIGARLARLADEIAVERGVEVLRVDCWAGAPTLVGWYEAQGFTRSGVFDVRGWKGQVFEKAPGA